MLNVECIALAYARAFARDATAEYPQGRLAATALQSKIQNLKSTEVL